MTDHLPECKALDVMPEATTMFHSTSRQWFWEHGCICDRLHACKQRVLDSARDAVDQVASDMANWSSAETIAATSVMPDLNVDQWIWAQRGMRRALAAIDALREKP